jgi:arsenate reductase
MTTENEESGKPRVLFLYTGNSARSLMAEALLRCHAGEKVEACSAGLKPSTVNPVTLRVLNEIGIDTSTLCSKGVDAFLGRVPVKHAIVVCERAQQSCPRLFPFATQNHYWPFEDPAAFRGTEEQTLEKFREVRDEIDHRIRQWVKEEFG